MKKNAGILALIFSLFCFAGCAVYGSLEKEDGIVVPLYDGALAWSFISSETAETDIPVTMTKEQADEIFSNIEVFGARLALPMKLSDLPEEFSILGDYNPDYGRSIDGRFFEFGSNIQYADENGRFETIANVCIITDGNSEEAYNNGIIVSMGLGMLSADVTINGAGTGDFGEEITAALGEGYLYSSESSFKYIIRVHSDGERMIKMIYGVPDEIKEVADIEEFVKNASPMMIDIIAHSEYRVLYSM